MNPILGLIVNQILNPILNLKLNAILHAILDPNVFEQKKKTTKTTTTTTILMGFDTIEINLGLSFKQPLYEEHRRRRNKEKENKLGHS